MKDKTMTLDEKSLLALICKTFDEKLARMICYSLTIPKSTFNKYWKIFGRKGVNE